MKQQKKVQGKFQIKTELGVVKRNQQSWIVIGCAQIKRRERESEKKEHY